MSKSTILMLVFWGVMSIFRLLDHYYTAVTNYETYFAFSMITTAGFMFAWFLEDARDINLIPSRGLKTGVVFLGLLVLPYYLFKYKGLKRASISILKFTGFAGLYISYTVVLELVFKSNA